MNLADPGTLRTFLSQHGLRAEKGLGQHFLCSPSVVSAIVQSLAGVPGLMEIGPGPGVLTSPLSGGAARMIALELDERMIAALRDSAPRAEVRQADALKADLAAVLAELPEPRGVVSNLPYYITGPLLTRIAEVRTLYVKAVLMMQKEVATRVLAKPGSSDRGSLSVYLQAQFEVRLLAHAPAGAFLPPPKVDSTVLEFTPRETGLSPEEEAPFFRLVRLAFAQPRKTLTNNLVAGYHVPRDTAVEWIESVGLAENVRAQALDHPRWIALSRRIETA